jgi:rRNA processing protein Krr1/Pno1
LTHPDPVQSRMAVPDAALLALLGSRDESLRVAEAMLEADVHVRGNELTLTGTPADVAFAERVFTELITLAERGQHVSTDAVRRTVEMLGDGEADERARIGESPAEVLSLDILSRRGKTIRPKTLNQKRYVDSIDAHTIVFGIGPAGTGKTYLAVANAAAMLERGEVARFILKNINEEEEPYNPIEKGYAGPHKRIPKTVQVEGVSGPHGKYGLEDERVEWDHWLTRLLASGPGRIKHNLDDDWDRFRSADVQHKGRAAHGWHARKADYRLRRLERIAAGGKKAPEERQLEPESRQTDLTGS